MPQTNKYSHRQSKQSCNFFPHNAEAPEAAARYDNLHFQAKLEQVFGLVEQTVVIYSKKQYNQPGIILFCRTAAKYIWFLKNQV